MFGHSLNDPNFCKHVGIPMVGIHVRFERLPMPYASVTNVVPFIALFLPRKFQKMQNFVENQNNLACLELIIQGHGNLGHLKDVGIQGALKQNLVATRTPSVELKKFAIHEMVLTFATMWACP